VYANGLTKGIFPMRLKFSQLNPLFKKGNKLEMANYRPISLLTSFSKIFEKVILTDYITMLIIIIFWLRNNMVLEIIYPLRQPHSIC